MIVLTFSMFGFIFTFLWIFFVEYLSNVELPASPQPRCKRCYKPTYGVKLESKEGLRLCIDCWEDLK